MADMSEGVLFDYESTQRLAKSNRLVEGNPSALYLDLPSGSMFDRPIDTSVPWEVLFVVSPTKALPTITTSSLMYTLILDDFLQAFTLPTSNTRLRNYRIHSFKIRLLLPENVTTDWIILPDNLDDPTVYLPQIHNAIDQALQATSAYNEDFYSYSFTSLSNGVSIAQFTFGSTVTLSTTSPNNSAFQNAGYIEELRYAEINEQRQIISSPTDAYFINPFYFYLSNHIIDLQSVNSSNYIPIVTYENYIPRINETLGIVGYLGYALGFRIEDSRYLVPNIPRRILYPLFTEGLLDDLPADL